MKKYFKRLGIFCVLFIVGATVYLGFSSYMCNKTFKGKEQQ